MGWTAAMMIGSTLLSAAGTQQAGKAQQAQLDYQADQAQADAQAEREYGQVQASKIRKAGQQQISATRANFASSGVDVSQGTPQSVNRQLMQDIEEDALNTILDSNRRSKQLEAQAQGYRAGVQNVGTATRINTGATLLQGGARALGGWRGVGYANSN